MGVPAFFRWLSMKYPKVVEDVLEERVDLLPDENEGEEDDEWSSRRRFQPAPFDATRPNPSGLECDNFYIDMNGIIHPCSHPEGEGATIPQTEEEMYDNVCLYVDRLFRAVRPRRLLYLAVDGTAPRAKMNQQRSRRFRAVQETRERKELEAKVASGLTKEEGFVTLTTNNGDGDGDGDDFKSPDKWDHNVITPGTPFMRRLTERVRAYVEEKMETDQAWKALKAGVIFSDASIPGEGEHKIMDHIRRQRACPEYRPDMVHIVHGLDADLIMLALATHEAHVYILREEILFGRRSEELNQKRVEANGHAEKQRELDARVSPESLDRLRPYINAAKPLVRINIATLREYLSHEFRSCYDSPWSTLPSAHAGGKHRQSFERVVDDVVFLCFFVGNDFLPHLPSLSIRDGGLDFVFNVYKSMLPSLGTYVTDHGGRVNLRAVGLLMGKVGSIEDHVFQMRHRASTQQSDQKKADEERRKAAKKAGTTFHDPRVSVKSASSRPTPVSAGVAPPEIMTPGQFKRGRGSTHVLREHLKKKRKAFSGDNVVKAAPVKQEEEEEETVDEVSKSKDDDSNSDKDSDDDDETVSDDSDDDDKGPALCSVKNEVAIFQDKETRIRIFKERVKAMEKEQLDNYANNVVDNVRLHEKGWKDRYYRDKCKADDVEDGGGRENLFKSYVVGLCWVLRYYYSGVPSWKWFYPFHYAPFASDLEQRAPTYTAEVSRTFACSTQPFSPVEQLLAVLPPESKHAVPKECRQLMSSDNSPIQDFYPPPSEIKVDPNGAAMPWLWVVLLPFIDEKRLLQAAASSRPRWTEEEQQCDSRGPDDGWLYTRQNLVQTEKGHNLPDSLKGTVRPLAFFTLKTKKRKKLRCLALREPKVRVHRSELLPGCRPAPPVLEPSDLKIRRPRLNRSTETIAYMGMSGSDANNNHHHHNGGMRAGTTGAGGNPHHSQTYGGGMHVDRSARERFQERNPHRSLPTGMRSWGTLEPQGRKKPPRSSLHGVGPSSSHHPPYHPPTNPFAAPPPPPHFAFPPPPPPPALQNGGFPPPPPRQRPPSNPNAYSSHAQRQQPKQWSPPPTRILPPGAEPPRAPPPQSSQQPQQQHYSHSFRNFRPYNAPSTNAQTTQRNHNHHHNVGANGGKPQVDPSLMQNLRSQLVSTLQRNKQKGKSNHNGV